MAQKKAKKPAKAMGKKELKRTKGGVLIGLNQPSFVKMQTPLSGGIIAPTDGKTITPSEWKF
jgi:hypothetical protein